MEMKYVLVDFFTDNTVHICEISQLQHKDITKLHPKNIHMWDKKEEAYLFWKKSSSGPLERWPCRVIQFSGKYAFTTLM